MENTSDLTSAGPGSAPRWAARVATLGGSVALVVSLLALFTYVNGGHSRPIGFFPYSPAMKPNTALCLLLLALAALWLRARPARAQRHVWALSAAGLAAAVALATVGEYLFSTDLGIDNLLFTLPRPRMSPIAACATASLALVLLLAALPVRATALCQSLLSFAGLLSLLPIMGYLYRAPFLYNPGALTAVAPGTGVSLLSLMVASFAILHEEGVWPLLVGDTAGSTLLRRALPAVVMLPVTFGWLRLEAEHLGNLGLELGVALIAVATVLTFAALLLWSARWLRDQDLARRMATSHLQEARNTLEMRVDERTRELTVTEVELRRVARNLLLAKEAAERAMRARADFLARMSHEMRTPLNGVVGMLEIALRSDLTAAQRGYVQTARSSADALLALISDVLDFSKIDVGKLLLESTPFRLRDCASLALRDSAAAAHVKGLELLLCVASEIPECLVGDAQRIRQVLTNLVSNAVKFTQHGEVRVTVSRSVRRHGSIGLTFEVADTGVGIARDKQQEIFQAFTQADETTTRRFGGTGLGLAISAQLVSLMGGELKVESEPGTGARFSFQLEIAIDHEAELLLDGARAALAGKRALLVESNQLHLEHVRELLERWGVDPVACEPAAALQVWREARAIEDPFALMLIDEASEASRGPSYLASVRAELGEGVPLVLLTLATELDTEREQRLKLCSSQLTKPVVASELFETLTSLLAEPKEKPERERPSQDEPLHVLVVEDNEVNRRVACFLLQSAGYKVASVEDGRKALAALAERNFDVVLMDGHMPELDGIEATREIRLRERGTGRHTPIIALTAQAMKGDRERYLAAGMDGYVTKPFQSAQLLAAIRDILGRSPQPPEREPRHPAPAQAAPVRTGPIVPVYERDQLLSRLRGAERILRQMVNIFGEEVPSLIGALTNAVAERQVSRVQQAAHKLSGALLTVGGSRAAQIARTMENYAREGSLAEADQLLAKLQTEVKALTSAMIDQGDLDKPAAATG
jgi:signal transduction histidine kinase/DNA-binding response OmpR family regulator